MIEKLAFPLTLMTKHLQMPLCYKTKVPFFHAHLMADQIDLWSTLGLDRRSSQWSFFHRHL